MGQSECLNILEKRNQWILSTELYKTLKQSRSVINSSLRRLCKQKLIKRRRRNITSHFEYEWRIII